MIVANAELAKLSIRYFNDDHILFRFPASVADENLNTETRRLDRPEPELIIDPLAATIQPAGKETVKMFTLEEGQRTEGMFTMHTEVEVFAASVEDGRSFADLVFVDRNMDEVYQVNQVKDQKKGDVFYIALLERFIENRDNDGERFVYIGTIVDKNGLPIP